MNGEKKLSEYVQSKLDLVNKDVDDIENKFGYHFLVSLPEVEQVLNINVNEIDHLNSEDCMKNSIMLTQHTFYLQKTINRAKHIKRWATRNIDKIIAKEYDNYTSPGVFMPVDIIKSKICRDNSFASELSDVVFKQDQIIDSLHDIVTHVSYLSNVFKNLYYAKRGNNNVSNSED